MPPHRLLLVVLTAAAIPLYGGITVETSLPDNTLISNPDVLDGAGNDDGSSRFAKMHAALQFRHMHQTRLQNETQGIPNPPGSPRLSGR